MARPARLHRLVLAACLAAVPLLAAAPALAQVAAGDTVSLALAGYNTASGDGYYLFGPLTTVFGTSQTFAAAGYAGQNITITSSESRAGNVITDLFSVSTPTNFLSGTTISGTLINALELDLGAFNADANPVNLVSAASGLTSVGDIRYGTGGASVLPLTPQTTLGTGSLSYSGYEGVNTSSTAGLYQFNIRQFDYSVSYTVAPVAAVPEPASWGLMMLGFGLVGGALRQRKRSAGGLPAAA